MRRVSAIVLLSLLHNTASAGCDTDTVQFYLDKGFTQEQITTLCAESTSSVPEYQPFQKPVVIYQEGGGPGNFGVSVEERRAINKIQGGLAARSIEVTETHFNYIAPICLRGGQSPELYQRVEHCIDVAYSVSRDGLKVVQSGQKFLIFGQKQLEISSNNITRKHVLADPWAGFSPDIRFSLKRKYEDRHTGNTTHLPIRNGSDIDEVASAVKSIAAATRTRSDGENQSEVARILDDSYVAPTKEEFLASQPEPVQKEPEKKKKWWNPFD